MEIALWQFAGPIPSRASGAGEIAFDAERRRMSVITRAPGRQRPAVVQGRPQAVLPLCTHWMDGDTPPPFDEDTRGRFNRAHADMADRGLRVLALAWRPLAASDEADEAQLALAGLVGLEDPPRPTCTRRSSAATRPACGSSWSPATTRAPPWRWPAR